MNITTSCHSWSLKNHKLEHNRQWVTDLHCKAKKDNGEWIWIQTRLDDFLGNDDGNFVYSSSDPQSNISSSMCNPRLELAKIRRNPQLMERLKRAGKL
ncbi:hypothetical protein ANOM_003626 [Aspergillus nomiae NRRL 13137]|uniref:Cyanovirin-N domain-containing protein n=1 Tax=Aspergillus nomiae NRRL (strain ATCC 15546 / NRRL 13137 / CBS 260.88 / M93) TaxID=1509407 RepID=A0A0L1J7I6_ASPN3|nr:uncharacterized protein ANOM_003626 [Aspergillus nomiae NRRL 13137]KNG87635.1 hypothetical protein ANOM_003626 [Aspergillus nomiae NRRL 13137]